VATTLPLDMPLPLERLKQVTREAKAEGRELRRLRKDFRRGAGQEITQVKMAQLLDVSPATYSRWERGLILCPFAVIELMRAWAREEIAAKRPAKKK
jgi:DNA-binding XRE family transcriptional regulator